MLVDVPIENACVCSGQNFYVPEPPQELQGRIPQDLYASIISRFNATMTDFQKKFWLVYVFFILALIGTMISPLYILPLRLLALVPASFTLFILILTTALIIRRALEHKKTLQALLDEANPQLAPYGVSLAILEGTNRHLKIIMAPLPSPMLTPAQASVPTFPGQGQVVYAPAYVYTVPNPQIDASANLVQTVYYV